MAQRAKESCAYQDSLEDDVEIFGSTQRSGAPGILQSTVSSRPANRAAAASFARRHRYNYRDDINAEDIDQESVASRPSDNNDEGLSDAKAVERAKPKIQRRRVGTARGRRSAILARSSRSTSVISSKTNQSQLSTTPSSSTKRTSVRSSNKQQSQILFISTSNVRTKHTVSSTIRRKRQITPVPVG